MPLAIANQDTYRCPCGHHFDDDGECTNSDCPLISEDELDWIMSEEEA